MLNQPIILLSFANDNDAYLEMLKIESHAIYQALEDVDNEEIVEVKREESATLDIIANRLNKYQEEIVIFHYSGHASGQHLQLEDSTANADGLAKLIASAPNMQLVVLNGCASYGQVEMLLELGVRAVIATTVAIGDNKAKEFSEQFYNALGEHKSIEQAFKQAIGYLEAKYSDVEAEASKPKKGLKLRKKTEKKNDIPWGLYYEDEAVLGWRINHNLRLKSLLRHGSKQYFQKLNQGRFEFLNINSNLLPPFSADMLNAYPPEEGDSTPPLSHALSIARQLASPHIFMQGDLGRGKTVSLLQAWQTLCDNNDNNQPIPIYISLSEYNISDHPKDFIVHYIATNYLGKNRPTNTDLNAIWELFKTPYQNMPFAPSVVLFLDGLDEINIDNAGLIYEIKNICQTTKGAQIVLTSRINYGFTWLNPFLNCHVLELSEAQIEAHLQATTLEIDRDSALFNFLKTPMLLTLYSETSDLREKYKADSRLEFKESINSYSELVWNFMESIIAKNSQNINAEEFAYFQFMSHHFIPYLAFYSEKINKYSLTKAELHEGIIQASTYLYKKAFLEGFPVYIPTLRLFGLESNDWLEELERSERKISFMINKLRLLSYEVIEGETLYFFSQRHYRDFFAAVHIYNDLKIARIEKQLPSSLSAQKLSIHNEIAYHVGELCGEHYNTSDGLKVRRTWKRNQVTRLQEALDICRNIYKNEANNNAIWNILTIWKRIRGHFADLDLSNLDLQEFLFDEIPLRHLRKTPLFPTNFQGSWLHDSNFITQGHTKNINSVIYSPDGTKILSASTDRTIKEWSISTGKCLHTLEGHTDVVKTICYHPNGKKVISGSVDGTIREWKLEDNETIQIWEAHKDGVTSVKYTADGKYIFSSGLDKTVKYWSTRKEDPLEVFNIFTTPIVKISVHPNGMQFVTATREVNFQEWELGKQSPIQTYKGHEGPVETVLYNADGSRILSSAYDLKIKEWNTATGECLQTLEGNVKPVIDCNYIPNKMQIVSCSGDTVKEWDLETGECVRTFETPAVSSIDYHPTRKRFISGSWDNMINEWNTFTARRLQTFEGYSNQVTALVLSFDNQFLYSGASDNSIRKWDTETGICVQALDGHTDTITSLSISNNNKWILSGSEDGTIRLWSSATGECIRTIETEQGEINAVTFNSNNRKILSTGHHLKTLNSTIKEWNARTGEHINTYTSEEEHDTIHAIIYNADGTLVASAHNEKIIKIWDVATDECIQILGKDDTGHSLAVYSIAFHPDGQHLISGSEDRSIRIWDVKTGECTFTTKAHKTPIESIAYNSAGTRFVTASRDKKIKEWDAKTGECIQILEGHQEMISSVVYSTDGQFIYSGSSDNTIKKWTTLQDIESKVKPSKSKMENEKAELIKQHKQIEDTKSAIENEVEKKEELGLFDSISKLKGIFTNTIKEVINIRKDDSIQTLVSASGLYLQGADFRNLHKKSKFSNASMDLMRQYGAIFNDEDAETWQALKVKLKRGR